MKENDYILITALGLIGGFVIYKSYKLYYENKGEENNLIIVEEPKEKLPEPNAPAGPSLYRRFQYFGAGAGLASGLILYPKVKGAFNELYISEVPKELF